MKNVLKETAASQPDSKKHDFEKTEKQEKYKAEKKENGKKKDIEKKKDKKAITEIVFILDRSGSMGGLETDTIGGYNSMLSKQKKEDGEAYVTTVLFDERIEILHDRENLKKVKPITDREYFVRGSTALLDAVGSTISRIKNERKNADSAELPQKTLFIITTDGMENASREYTYNTVKKLVEQQKKKDKWEFIFLGANIDAVAVAGRFGISEKRAVRYECDSAGTQLNFDVMSKMVSCARECATADMMEKAFDDDALLAPIQADFKKRHK